ncbi:unnamed protein product [Penicillium pancosmium]
MVKMHVSTFVASLAVAFPTLALPTTSPPINLQSTDDAIPGESALFNTYSGKDTPLAAEHFRVIAATSSGPAGPDDLLFQNLLSAEWAIYTFYQQAAEAFSFSSFTKLGLPNSTYQRILEIRNNEAGHLRIFQDQISNNSIKPGPSLQVYLEVSSMAFLTGLARQANLNVSKSALMAIGQVETRHNVWSLIDIWNTSPFSGPSDTVYPYPNQILDSTNAFIIPGSCPDENPIYPSPRQDLPQLAFSKNGTTARPGSELRFVFDTEKSAPKFDHGEEYYAVFYHGLNTVSVPYDSKNNVVKIPSQFDPDSGIIMVSIADQRDAPTEESVVAGPLIILEQPGRLTLKEPSAV